MCNKCGKCCNNNLLLSEKEIIFLSEYVVTHNIKENNNTDSCPFLDERYLCSIYEIRPDICKYYDCSDATAGVEYILSDTEIQKIKEIDMKSFFVEK